MDPFASVGRECGAITASQDDLLRDAPFISAFQLSSDGPPPTADAPLINAAHRSFSSSDGPHPTADAPILICSPLGKPPPPSSSAAAAAAKAFAKSKSAMSPARDLSLPAGGGHVASSSEQRGPPLVVKSKMPGTSPSKTLAAAGSENLGFDDPVRKIAMVSGRRSRGPIIIDPDCPPQTSAQSIEVPKGNPNTAHQPSTNKRKLPASILGGSDDAQVSPSEAAASSDGNLAFPSTLLDAVRMFSGKLNQRFEDADILEIAAMKGIVFPKPRWWRPGGYDAKVDQRHH